MNTLLFLLTTMVAQGNPEFPCAEVAVTHYPETVMPGDTIYVMVVAKNPHAESVYINDTRFPGDILIYLKDAEGQQSTHSGKSMFSPMMPPPPDVEIILTFVEIKPGESRVLITTAVNVPSLVDLNALFWEKHLANLSTGDEKFSFCIDFKAYCAKGSGGGDSQPILHTLEMPIMMKQRPEKEMALIQKWNKTLFDYLESEQFQKSGVFGPKDNMPKNVAIKNDKFSHWYFVRMGNLYPNTSDIPGTWQGWKELEESMTPSTMRDEIRLTRMLIQYCDCDTEDAKVLTELKDWFKGMNEVQRTVMAKNVCDLAWESRGTKLYEPYKKIYATVREYDIAAKPDFMIKYLIDAGLLETPKAKPE